MCPMPRFFKLRDKVYLLSRSGKVSLRHIIRYKVSKPEVAADRVRFTAVDEQDGQELGAVKNLVSENLLVYDDFITEEEETMLYEEVKPYLEKRSYQNEHWDDVSKK